MAVSLKNSSLQIARLIARRWPLLTLFATMLWGLVIRPASANAWMLLESDEVFMWQSVRDFTNPSAWGYGALLRPAFALLGYGGSQLGLQGLNATKTISWLAFIGILFTLYFSLPLNIRGWALLFFALSPLSVFYARVGLPELLIGLSSYGFVLLFIKSLERVSLGLALISGVLLGGLVSLKHQGLLYFLLPVFFLPAITKPPLNGWKDWAKNIRRGAPISLNSLSIMTLLISLITFAPFALWAGVADPKRYVFSWMRELAAHSSRLIGEEFGKMGLLWLYWITIPIAVLSVCGLIILFREKRQRLLSYGVMIILPFFLFSPVPRYWAQLIPIMAMLSAYGAEYLVRRFRWLGIGLVTLSLVVVAPFTTIAFWNANSLWFEQTLTFLRVSSPQARGWLFSNYWPHSWFVSDPSALHATWLTIDAQDASVFSLSGVVISAADIPPPDLPINILEDDGGIVILLDKPQTYADPDPPMRREAAAIVRSRYQPAWTWLYVGPSLPLSLIPAKVEMYVIAARRSEGLKYNSD